MSGGAGSGAARPAEAAEARAGALVFFDERMALHQNGPGHPERPERLAAARAALLAAPALPLVWRAPRPAERGALERVHAPAYVDAILALRGRAAQLDPDTGTSPESVDAALLAAGAALGVVEALAAGEARVALALVRPPGHHAERARAMGFCLFGNAAIAAAHARAALGFERVLVVDWDVHHGNGTQQAFSSRADVLFFSAHEYPFYPGTGALTEQGEGEGAGFTVNAPLPRALGDGDWAHLFARVLEPIAASFAPDLVLVSAGYDAHARDPLGGMRLSAAGFAALAASVRRVAERAAGGRVGLFLEGGYDLGALGDSLRATLEALLREAPPPPPPPPSPRGEEIVRAIARAHAARWPALSAEV